MKYTTASTLAALAGLASAELPQEHSHRKYLIAVNELLLLNNPFEIDDTVFGFLGNAAAEDGAGLVENLDCLQQITADSAFTGAKDAGDIDGMANALIFRALERNSVEVGLRSELCNETAVNPEIDVISQHQDPASEGAAEENKAITLALAQQLALIGADPLLALESGTFAPGELGDPTAAGNTCNDEEDDVGCIFTENLLVPDATAEEIDAAVAEVLNDGAAADLVQEDSLADSLASICQNIDDVVADDDEDEDAAATTSAAAETETAVAEDDEEEDEEVVVEDDEEEEDEEEVAEDEDAEEEEAEEVVEEAEEEEKTAIDGENLQRYTGNVGARPPAVIRNGANIANPFEVNGNLFANLAAAITRSCAIQNNACFNAINSGILAQPTTVCVLQEQQCLAAAGLRKVRRNARAVTHTPAGKLRFARAVPRVSKRQALDFGECADPSIQFVAGLDGRDEESFGPAGDFDQGSALNIDIISSFICGQLASRCDASDEAVSACEDGADAASALEGQAAADAFNTALGL